jgi:D-glycero-D-manno-heptose 1,7-bisphosphate phosphatase
MTGSDTGSRHTSSFGSSGAAPRAVLFDRDGTLVVDVPYNADPDRVAVMPSAARALDLLRAEGIAIGVVTNQSGIARGIISANDVSRVNQRIDQLLGPFDTWCVCPHCAEDGCGCRKPLPGLIFQAARDLGISPTQIALIGDIGSDMDAASAAGASAVLVPTPLTRLGEVLDAPLVAADLLTAVRMVLAGLSQPEQELDLDGVDHRALDSLDHRTSEAPR